MSNAVTITNMLIYLKLHICHELNIMPLLNLWRLYFTASFMQQVLSPGRFCSTTDALNIVLLKLWHLLCFEFSCSFFFFHFAACLFFLFFPFLPFLSFSACTINLESAGTAVEVLQDEMGISNREVKILNKNLLTNHFSSTKVVPMEQILVP